MTMRITLFLIAALLALACSSGCNVIGYAAQTFGGPTVHEPKFTPASRPTVVLVDNYRTKSPTTALRDALATLLTEELEEHKVAPMIGAERVYDLRIRDAKAFKNMKLEEVGRAVGADQIIYVDVLQANIESTLGDQLIKGDMAVTIKVVDARTGETLWPKNFEDGFPFSVEMKYAPTSADNSATTLQDAMARQSADGIAKMFYKYTTDDD